MNADSFRDIPRILPNGRCSECTEKVRKKKDGWVFIRSRLLRINETEGVAQVLCPQCKLFLALK